MADECTVIFDPARFKERYPAFAGVSDSLLQSYFDEAGLYLANDCCSVVKSMTKREQLLWMLTAHLAQINGATNGGIPTGMVGRTSSATEGSVSISSEYNAPWTAAWFAQTPYGASFWQATAYLRSFRYRPRCTRY
jgi:hypothetical protein